jgi:predicted DNA-binding protein (UPF0251 family)
MISLPGSARIAVVSVKFSRTSGQHRAMLTDDWPSLDVLRLRYIAQVIERNGGNKTRAADMLGIDRRTLNRILARERAKAAAAARGYRPLNKPPILGEVRAAESSATPAPLAAAAGRG